MMVHSTGSTAWNRPGSDPSQQAVGSKPTSGSGVELLHADRKLRARVRQIIEGDRSPLERLTKLAYEEV